MEKIAFCGLNCEVCPAYIATINNDDKKRKTTAETWSKLFNANIKAEDVNCEGCKSTGGILFSHCKVCTIRDCASDKKYDNCAYCNEYDSCNKINDFLKYAPEAKETLNKIRKTL